MKEEAGEFITLKGAHRLRLPVQSSELPPVNKPCTLAIRPEQVELAAANTRGENTLSAEVRQIEFSGAVSTFKLDANGLVIEALRLGSPCLAIGDTCSVVLPRQKLTLLSD